MQLSLQQRRAVAAALKSHLKNHNLSFAAFAEETGINNNTVSKLTQPDKFENVQKSTQRRVAKALGVEWNKLIANGHAAPRLVRPANGHVKAEHHRVFGAAQRMLVIELAGSRISIPAGVDISILDSSTIRVR